jgi:uncharacterized membrane protein
MTNLVPTRLQLPRLRSAFGRFLWVVAAILSVGVALFSYRYLPRLGLRSPEILANLFARPFLDLHIAGAATALLVSPFQFLSGMRTRMPRLHRRLGRLYAVACLTGAVGGFVLAFGSTAGPIAGVGFGSLAIVWFVTTAQGWRTAMMRRFVDHRAWMIRSVALTFAAVTLRLYLPLFPLLGLRFVDGYRAVSFLCWIPNLILAELYLRRGNARQKSEIRVPGNRRLQFG